MIRSLNKVLLIGNVTNDPDIRTTPSGALVCQFTVATNRAWTTEAGEKRVDAQYHECTAWGKLADICSKVVAKGKPVYCEGRLQHLFWTDKQGIERNKTEIALDNILLLENRDNGTTTT